MYTAWCRATIDHNIPPTPPAPPIIDIAVSQDR